MKDFDKFCIALMAVVMLLAIISVAPPHLSTSQPIVLAERFLFMYAGLCVYYGIKVIYKFIRNKP
tara:strand:+ start:202 stop:396 length:195 start_codon:yes stop_codon:yes gene_type:complete